MRHRTSRWLASLAVLAVGAALHGQGPLPLATPPSRAPANPPAATRQGKTLRVTRNVAGDAKPVVVEADRMFTWSEDGRTVLLLEGGVLIQHGVTQARFQRGAVWADLNAYKAKGVLQVTFYGEGQARMDTAGDTQSGDFAIGDLNTRGEFRLRVPRGRVASQDHSRDPLVDRARAAGVGRRAMPTIVPTGGTLPAVPGLQPIGTTPPAASGVGLRPAVFRTTGAPAPALLPVRSTTSDAAPIPLPVTPPRTTLPPIPAGSPAGSPPPPVSSLPGGSVPPGGTPAPAPTPIPGPPAALPAPAPVPGPPPLPSSRQVPVPAPTPAPAPPTLTAPRRLGGLEYRIGPRTGTENWNLESTRLDDGRWLITISNGVVLSVRGFGSIGSIEVEADRAVVWTRPNKDSRPAPGEGQAEEVKDLEFYMAGHVVMRTERPKTKDSAVIEADELYYDTSRHVAIALQSRLQLRPAFLGGGAPKSTSGQSGQPAPAKRVITSEPVIIASDQLFQTSENTYEFLRTEVFSSKLPSDPGLKFTLARGTLEERRIPRRNILGQPVLDPKTGQPLSVTQDLLKGENVFGAVEGIPFFYTPYLYTDVKEPLGPIQNIRLGGNGIFGFEAGLTLDMYKVLGILPIQGTSWKLYPDYLSNRGPALGSQFNYQGKFFPPTPDEAKFFPEKVRSGDYIGNISLFGIQDHGHDNLGARNPDLLTFQSPAFRGRATWRNFMWDLPGGFDVIAGAAFFSDRNYLEQYFKREFDNDPNQATFAFVKQQDDYWAWSALGQVRVNDWITTTEWLPRLDGYLQGISLFDRIVSNTHASAGYARLATSNDPISPLAVTPPNGFTSYPFLQTTQPNSTGRAFVYQELMLPLAAGPVTFMPYVKGMAAEYTQDLAGNETGRVWGALGLRASMPLSRLYADARNDLLNIDGLMHKMTFSGNYMTSRANQSYTKFGQLDRLDDDATAQMRREFTPYQPLYNQQYGTALATSRLFDPQLYAIRRLVDNRIDTLDSIDVAQLELRQRLQTRRGYPGSQHIVDWMSLDTTVSLFPRADRDNFGKSFSFLQYRYLWSIGDRTNFESTGWYDPQDNGARVSTIGLYFDRPDRTQFYIGYRQIDPLLSRVATGSVTYLFSPKYAMTLSAAYDFGLSKSLSNTLIFTRTGRDLSVSLGFTYNSLQNNLGLVLQIVPNLLGPGRGLGGAGALASGGGFGR